LTVVGLGKAGLQGLDRALELADVGSLTLTVLSLGFAIGGTFSCSAEFILEWFLDFWCTVEVAIAGAG
jgi:hypothetical protein